MTLSISSDPTCSSTCPSQSIALMYIDIRRNRITTNLTCLSRSKRVYRLFYRSPDNIFCKICETSARGQNLARTCAAQVRMWKIVSTAGQIALYFTCRCVSNLAAIRSVTWPESIVIVEQLPTTEKWSRNVASRVMRFQWTHKPWQERERGGGDEGRKRSTSIRWPWSFVGWTADLSRSVKSA